MPGERKNRFPDPDGYEMPLVSGLYKLARENRDSWHMPAHNGGRAWPAWLRNSLASLDTTELPQTGDLNHPAGPVPAAERLASQAFGTGCSRLITSGSTTAIRVMLTLFAGRHGKIMLPRASHQSMISTAALLELDICWIEPLQAGIPADLFDLIPRVTADDVEAGFQKHPNCRVVVITSPDYYGGCLDLVSISRIVHAHKAYLLVDEAHGAHLPFGGERMPLPAMKAGADASVNSGHKTLPVFTAGAWIHVSASALESGIDAADLDRLIPVFQTSSPSFPTAATLDYARAWMTASGLNAIKRQLSHIKAFHDHLPDEFITPDFQTPSVMKNAYQQAGFQRDPMRLVIRRQTAANTRGKGPAGLPMAPAAAWLSDHGIDIEFADMTRMVLIPSILQTKTAWTHLADSLRSFAASRFQSGDNGACDQDEPDRRLDILETEWRRLLADVPANAVTPGEALLCRHKLAKVRLQDAAGKISAASIMPVPPGIPVICPGEVIDQARVDFLAQLSENGIDICGISQGSLLVLS